MAEVDGYHQDPPQGLALQELEQQIDPVTNLPLVVCPDCKDVIFVAYTVRNPESPNLGRRFFKCPRNSAGAPKRCWRYCFQEDYEQFLQNAPPTPLVNENTAAQPMTVESVAEQDSAAVVGSEMPQQDAPTPAVSEDPPVTPAVKKQETHTSRHEVAVMFWLKFISIQMLLLNFLMAFLVSIVISR